MGLCVLEANRAAGSEQLLGVCRSATRTAQLLGIGEAHIEHTIG